MMVISGVQSVGLNKTFALLYTRTICMRLCTLKVVGRIVLLLSRFFFRSDFPLPALLDFDVGSSSFCYFMNLISVDFTSLC